MEGSKIRQALPYVSASQDLVPVPPLDIPTAQPGHVYMAALLERMPRPRTSLLWKCRQMEQKMRALQKQQQRQCRRPQLSTLICLVVQRRGLTPIPFSYAARHQGHSRRRHNQGRGWNQICQIFAKGVVYAVQKAFQNKDQKELVHFSSRRKWVSGGSGSTIGAIGTRRADAPSAAILCFRVQIGRKVGLSLLFSLWST